MGRGIATEPVPVEFVKAGFAVTPDGQIVRRACRIGSLAHEPATFSGPNGVAMVRVTYNGKIRRLRGARGLCARQGSLAERAYRDAPPQAVRFRRQGVQSGETR